MPLGQKQDQITLLLLPSDSLILSPAGWTEKQDLCFSFVWLCSCLCCRSSEGRGHPGPHYISWQRPIRTGLHLQAAVPSGAAAVRGLRVQGRHLLLGRTELHDCRQDLWQQDPRVRLRDCNGGLFLSLPFPADFNKDSFLLTAGQPCWTVKPRAQETTASPCWRALLHSHSQMKVCSHSVCPPQKCNAGLAYAAMTMTRKKSNQLV